MAWHSCRPSSSWCVQGLSQLTPSLIGDPAGVGVGPQPARGPTFTQQQPGGPGPACAKQHTQKPFLKRLRHPGHRLPCAHTGVWNVGRSGTEKPHPPDSSDVLARLLWECGRLQLGHAAAAPLFRDQRLRPSQLPLAGPLPRQPSPPQPQPCGATSQWPRGEAVAESWDLPGAQHFASKESRCVSFSRG